MRSQRDIVWLAFIIILVAGAIWVITNPRFPIRYGLDLQGGLQVLMEADVPADQVVTSDAMDTARQIVDRRVNAIGVTEPLVQVEGNRRILVELPGIEDPEQALALIQETALLEFVDTGEFSLPEGREPQPLAVAEPILHGDDELPSATPVEIRMNVFCHGSGPV